MASGGEARLDVLASLGTAEPSRLRTVPRLELTVSGVLWLCLKSNLGVGARRGSQAHIGSGGAPSTTASLPGRDCPNFADLATTVTPPARPPPDLAELEPSCHLPPIDTVVSCLGMGSTPHCPDSRFLRRSHTRYSVLPSGPPPYLSARLFLSTTSSELRR